MPKFTPRAEPKNPVLHDTSSKNHITFDDSDNDEPAPKRVKRESTEVSGKTMVKKNGITRGSVKDNANAKKKVVEKEKKKMKRATVIREVKKATVIAVPKVTESSITENTGKGVKFGRPFVGTKLTSHWRFLATVTDQVLLKVQKLRQKKKERRKAKKLGTQVCTYLSLSPSIDPAWLTSSSASSAGAAATESGKEAGHG